MEYNKTPPEDTRKSMRYIVPRAVGITVQATQGRGFVMQSRPVSDCGRTSFRLRTSSKRLKSTGRRRQSALHPILFNSSGTHFCLREYKGYQQN